MEKQLSNELGFYYVVMQRTLQGHYINCWIDGSDYPEYYTYEELVDLAKKSLHPSRVILGLNQVLNETSIFIWDVDNEIVSRVSATSNSSYNLSQDLQQSFQRELANKQNSSSTFTNVTFQNNQIKLKI